MVLTEEQKRERKLERYQMNLEYIKKYREKDTLYHVTLKENALSLLQNGFDPKKIGTQGGCQGGAGFSCTWCAGDARDWGSKLYGWGNEHHLSVVKVSLPGVKIATHQQADQAVLEGRKWGIEQGYFLQEEDGIVSSPKLKGYYGMSSEFSDHGWTVIGLYLRSIGYDGYFLGIDEIIIVNFDILQASAFSLVEK